MPLPRHEHGKPDRKLAQPTSERQAKRRIGCDPKQHGKPDKAALLDPKGPGNHKCYAMDRLDQGLENEHLNPCEGNMHQRRHARALKGAARETRKLPERAARQNRAAPTSG